MFLNNNADTLVYYLFSYNYNNLNGYYCTSAKGSCSDIDVTLDTDTEMNGS